MSVSLRTIYDSLHIWLEERNAYDVKSTDKDLFTDYAVPPHRRITFTVDPAVVETCRRNNKPVPALPSLILLAMRAACSRVAHMSGAVEQMERVLCDLEDTRVMAEDGATADLLTSLLSVSGVTITRRRRLFPLWLLLQIYPSPTHFPICRISHASSQGNNDNP
ncbi:hypothetical protein DXG03_000416 [Asterophora parasitica]|uniref:Uncharacterized protein n=1 Tax=Asterophora parasitica TaxID=117018 RepID=A0A9P7GC48_9AGAR|nr:hypothetical protein DXG03_000416 [Asterophora parasitica]